MPNTTIREIGDLEGGDQIKELRVTVKSAFAPRSGENEYGEWKVQAAMVTDDTGTMRCSFYDYPRDIRQLQGNDVVIKAGKDGKGRASGIEALDYEDRKKNTVTRQIKVNANATIDEVAGDSAGSDGNVSTGRSKSKSASYASAPDEKGISIEKQVALKAAIKLARIRPDDQSFPAAIVANAKMFYNEFFAPPPKPKPEPQPEAPAESEEKAES